MNVIQTLNGLKFNWFALKFEYLLITNLWVGVPERTVVLQGVSDFNVSACVLNCISCSLGLPNSIYKGYLAWIKGGSNRGARSQPFLRQVPERGWGGSSEGRLWHWGRALLHPSPSLPLLVPTERVGAWLAALWKRCSCIYQRWHPGDWQWGRKRVFSLWCGWISAVCDGFSLRQALNGNSQGKLACSFCLY